MIRHMEKQKGIQTTLFLITLMMPNILRFKKRMNWFRTSKTDVNAPSIRARIYEGINKGLFERVGKGLYTVTRKDDAGHENTCLLINGDGRDLLFLKTIPLMLSSQIIHTN